MAFIAVNELSITGSELFQDSESYLTELNNLDAVNGGRYIGYFGGAATIYDLVAKGFEFGLYTLGFDVILHFTKSFSVSIVSASPAD
jgi:hypothetical protein